MFPKEPRGFILRCMSHLASCFFSRMCFTSGFCSIFTSLNKASSRFIAAAWFIAVPILYPPPSIQNQVSIRPNYSKKGKLTRLVKIDPKIENEKNELESRTDNFADSLSQSVHRAQENKITILNNNEREANDFSLRSLLTFS